jgi:cystathionine beta-lyase family protein involved in aluminum resistance
MAATGDYKCVGFACANGGTYGTTGGYLIGNKPVCLDCAIKILGIGDEPLAERYAILKNFELPAGG